MWSCRWGIIEFLYLFSRYMPFVDTPVMLIYREVPVFHTCSYLEHLSQCRLLLSGSEHWSMSHCFNSTMQWVAALWPGFHRGVTKLLILQWCIALEWPFLSVSSKNDEMMYWSLSFPKIRNIYDSDMGSLGKTQSRRARSLHWGSYHIRRAILPYFSFRQLFDMWVCEFATSSGMHLE